MIKTIGIDLSLVASGLVVLEDGKLHSKNLIKSKPSGKLPINELIRLQKISDEVAEIAINNKPELACIENLAFMAHNTCALTQLAGLSYLVRNKLNLAGIPFVMVAPTTLKKFLTGKGNIKKDMMLMAAYKRYGLTFDNDNIADGFALAKVAYELLSDNKVPSFQKEVLELLKIQL